MTSYQLIKTANQRFNTNIGNNNFEFDFHTFRGVLYSNVRINGAIADVNVICTPNRSLYNSVVNSAAGGEFMFISSKSDYPNFEDFDGSTCTFVFIPFGEK